MNATKLNATKFPIAINQAGTISIQTYLQGATVGGDKIGDDWEPNSEPGLEEDEELLDCRATPGEPLGTILYSRDCELVMKRPGQAPVEVPSVTDTALARLSPDCKQVLWLDENETDDLMSTSLDNGETKKLLSFPGESVRDFQVGHQ